MFGRMRVAGGQTMCTLVFGEGYWRGGGGGRRPRWMLYYDVWERDAGQ